MTRITPIPRAANPGTTDTRGDTPAADTPRQPGPYTPAVQQWIEDQIAIAEGQPQISLTPIPIDPHPTPRWLRRIILAGLVTLAAWLVAELVIGPWITDRAAQAVVRAFEQ